MFTSLSVHCMSFLAAILAREYVPKRMPAKDKRRARAENGTTEATDWTGYASSAPAFTSVFDALTMNGPVGTRHEQAQRPADTGEGGASRTEHWEGQSEAGPSGTTC
jgi:hypothetical protein